MQRESARSDVLFADGIADELLGELRTLTLGDHPADDVAAENIEQVIEVVCLPFSRPFELGDVPRPHFARPARQQLRSCIDGMNALTTSLANLALRSQQPIHGANRAVITAFIEQSRKHGGRCHVSEALAVEYAQ